MLIFMGMSGIVFCSNQFVFVLILAGFFFLSPLCLRNVDSEGGGGDYLDF